MRKANLLPMAFGMLCLASCYSPMEEASSEDDSRSIVFGVHGDFTLSCETMTRSNVDMTADGSEMTDLWVIDLKDGVILQEIHQKNSDDDWGAPTLNMTMGAHHVLFLASRGQSPDYTEGTVSWRKPLDTFYTDYEITVDRSSAGSREVSLSRVATKLQLGIVDAIAEGTTSIVIRPTVWYNGWDMIQGRPVIAQDYTNTVVVPASWWGATDSGVSSWSLSGTSEWTTDVSVTSYAGDVVNATASVSGVPMMANRMTLLTGYMYSRNSAANLRLNTTWIDAYEGVY